MLARGHERFGQTGFFVPGVQREVENGDSCVPKPVGNFGAEQTPVGADVYPESIFGGVINDFVRKIRPQQGLASHQRQDTQPWSYSQSMERRATSSVIPLTLLL